MIKEYEPLYSEDQLYLWLGGLVAVIAFGAMALVIRKEFSYEEQTKKWLIALLLFIVGIISTGTAFFSWLSDQRVGVVKIYTDRLEVGKKELEFGKIKKIDLRKEQEKSMVNPNIVRREYNLLFIEDLEGRMFVISERSYPVREIMQEIKKALQEWKE